MSDAIKDLISQILDKDFVGANSTFESLVAEKIQDRLDDEEMKIAAKLYNDIDYDEMMDEAKKSNDDDDDDDDEEETPKSKKKMKEEVELSELSKKTLSSYAKKANVSGIAATATMMASKSGSPDQKKYSKIAGKRIQGVHRAVDRMAKESVEELDELSKKTLGSYVKKAVKDHGMANRFGAKGDAYATAVAKRREKGITRAADRMAKD